MAQILRVFPWLLSAVLAVLLALTWQQSQQKDEALENAKQQYNQLVSDANAKLQDANSKYKQLADDANKKIEIASQREVQVRVSFRKALISSGYVAGISNQSSQSIAVTADIARPSSGKKSSVEITLDPGQAKEIGEREGWAFLSGDTVTVSQPDHKSLIFTVQ